MIDGQDGEEGGRVVRDAAHAVDVRQIDELLGLERRGDGSGGGIRVDVVALAVLIHADGGDDGDILVRAKGIEQLGVHLDDVAHMAQVHAVGQRRLLRHLNQSGILAAQADGLAAQLADLRGDVLVELAGQHHLHDLHRRVVGDAQAVVEAAAHADAPQHGVDLRPAAVYENGVDAHVLEQCHVLENLAGQIVIDHGSAAVLDDDGLAPQALDIGQGLDEDIRFIDEVQIGIVHDLIFRHGKVSPCLRSLARVCRARMNRTDYTTATHKYARWFA